MLSTLSEPQMHTQRESPQKYPHVTSGKRASDSLTSVLTSSILSDSSLNPAPVTELNGAGDLHSNVSDSINDSSVRIVFSSLPISQGFSSSPHKTLKSVFNPSCLSGKRKTESCHHLESNYNTSLDSIIKIPKPVIGTPRLKLVCLSEQEVSAYTPLPVIYPIQKKRNKRIKIEFPLPTTLLISDEDKEQGKDGHMNLLTTSKTRVNKTKKTLFHSKNAPTADLTPEVTMSIYADIEAGLSSAVFLECTERRAFIMVKWSIMTNERLRQIYSINSLLGWGGCGAVLGAQRRSDNMQVTSSSSLKFKILIFLGCNQNYIQKNQSQHQ